MGPTLRMFATFTMAVAVLAACGAENSENVRRGREWLELGELDRARDECSQALTATPRSLAARECLALAALGRPGATNGDVRGALELAREMDGIRPNSAEARRVRAAADLVLLNQLQSNSNATRYAIGVIRNYHTPATAMALSVLVREPGSEFFEEAVTALGAIDATLAAQSLQQGFTSSDPLHKQRCARALWRLNRSPAVAAYMREDTLLQIRSAQGDERHLVTLFNQLADTGFDGAKPHFAAIVQAGVLETGPSSNQPSESVRRRAAAAYTVWRQHDSSGADAAATAALLRSTSGQPGFSFCDRLGQAFTDGVAQSQPRPVALVRDMFGRAALGSSCIARLQELLATIDTTEWRNMPLYYPGWTIFGTMIAGRLSDLREQNQRLTLSHYAARNWDLATDPALTERIRQFMLQWGEYSAFSGGTEIGVSYERAEYESPQRARLTYNLIQRYRGDSRQVGRIVVVVERRGRWDRQPWTITEIVELVRL